MGANSKIGWCDHTMNPWWGCTKVDDGCKFCYAESLSNRYGNDVWGPTAGRRQMSDNYWKQPFAWNRKVWQCLMCGEWFEAPKHHSKYETANKAFPRSEAGCLCNPNDEEYWARRRPRVFCASMADVFEGPETCQDPDAYAMIQRERIRLFDVIRQTPNLDWLLLTKRPENVQSLVYDLSNDPAVEDSSLLADWLGNWTCGDVPPNVWLGTSVADAKSVHRAAVLAEIPAVVRFLSVEPMIGRVTLDEDVIDRIDWVICGGESGSHARPMHPMWAADLRDQCVAADVPFFFKQWGNHTSEEREGDTVELATLANNQSVSKGRTDHHYTLFTNVGKHAAGRVLDGRTWDEFPTPRATT